MLIITLIPQDFQVLEIREADEVRSAKPSIDLSSHKSTTSISNNVNMLKGNGRSIINFGLRRTKVGMK